MKRQVILGLSFITRQEWLKGERYGLLAPYMLASVWWAAYCLCAEGVRPNLPKLIIFAYFKQVICLLMIFSLSRPRIEVIARILLVLDTMVEAVMVNDQLPLAAHFFYSTLLFFFSKLNKNDKTIIIINLPPL